MVVKIYTDGAAKGNPGNGGYGVVMRFDKFEKELSEGFRMTTNNRMELLAVIVALESMKTNEFKIHIYSDSKYVIDSISKGWIYNWKKTGFKGKKNQDLWLRYMEVASKFQLELYWVKGHAGHPENERCDYLAVKAAEGKDLKIDTFFENLKKEEKLL
ncbi:MAG: ribonuclease HI [Flavobacteriia bacterium]|nr:ribonuclease HI [Flavobacteriia bacterium]